MVKQQPTKIELNPMYAIATRIGFEGEFRVIKPTLTHGEDEELAMHCINSQLDTYVTQGSTDEEFCVIKISNGVVRQISKAELGWKEC